VPLVMCDLDDTLIDRQAAFARWAAHLASQHADDADLLDWLIQQDQRGMRPRIDFLSKVRERCGLKDDAPHLVDQWERNFPASFTPDPRVHAALGRARVAGWKIAIVTNGKTNIQFLKAQAAGLLPLVDALVVSETEGVRKPDSRIFQLAASRADSTLEGAWMIGDHVDADIGGAGSLGLSTIWLRLGRPWPDVAHRPTHTVEDVIQAIEVVLAG
jgi:putative hydrolase of the HAD superfamily